MRWHRELEDQLKHPCKLEIDRDGQLVILVDPASPTIHWVQPGPPTAINTSSDLTRRIDWGYALDLLVLPSGSIAVSDYSDHCVCILTPGGQLLYTLGVCGQYGSTPGLLYFPRGLQLTTDTTVRLLVADEMNARISVFTAHGHHLGNICVGLVSKPRSVLVITDGLLVVGELDGAVKTFDLLL